MVDALERLTPRMRDLLEAAVSVVASDGLRGLTHRAIDTRAGLPQGTCSAYLRTRQALLAALTEYVAARLARDIAGVSARLAQRPGDADHAAAETTRLFVGWLTDGDLVVARLELTLEAARVPELAAVFQRWREQLVAVVADVIEQSMRAKVEAGVGAGAGPEVPVAIQAEALVAALEGVLLAALSKPLDERRSYVGSTVGTVLGAFAGHDR